MDKDTPDLPALPATDDPLKDIIPANFGGKPIAKLEEWVVIGALGYGIVTGHNRLSDGLLIHTSTVLGIYNINGQKIMETLNTVYILGKPAT